MSVALAIFELAQEGNHLTCCRLPTNRNFVHGGPTGRAAQRHRALGKRKGIAMVTSDKKPAKLHLFEIPADIKEFTDAQIQAWAEKVSEKWAEMLSEEGVPILKDERSKEKVLAN